MLCKCSALQDKRLASKCVANGVFFSGKKNVHLICKKKYNFVFIS